MQSLSIDVANEAELEPIAEPEPEPPALSAAPSPSPDYTIIFRATLDADPRTHNLPTVREVAVILPDHPDGDIVYCIIRDSYVSCTRI